MKLEDLNRAIKAFRKRLLKNGTWEDGAIELDLDAPDWDWVTFSAMIHLHGSGEPVSISATWSPKTKRLGDWEGAYTRTFKKYEVL